LGAGVAADGGDDADDAPVTVEDAVADADAADACANAASEAEVAVAAAVAAGAEPASTA
jgi:hypothetical protein